ncbi:hypothetical protein E1B28_007840 [Marasmius oreades]|uniref:Uncharacterized protein n=1 Tax=Marasmius oreades TaxID=181124 RepID=A0A9P7UVZ7_9AGAR|nr:uncharacterized protein E1B28_007840 [Marasmius oreades]KAG7094234.1 hypothetical protein E1B28_007840 [Marasmius oreades]
MLQGEPIELTLDRVVGMEMKRGGHGENHQTYLLPVNPNILRLPLNSSIESTRAALQGQRITFSRALYHSRWIILEFQVKARNETLYLAVQPLLHTCVNVFPNAVWDTTVRNANRKCKYNHDGQIGRRFKIGLAVHLGEYIIAFCSYDNLFGVQWSTNVIPDAVPIQDALNPCNTVLPHINLDGTALGSEEVYDTFLGSVAEWATKRLKSRSDDYLVTALRTAEGPFLGLGVYTSTEILWYAGLSPWLRLKEVLHNPSRLARLCEACYTFMMKSHQYNRWVHVKEMDDTNISTNCDLFSRMLAKVLNVRRSAITLNATTQEVLDYARSHLIIYGRATAQVSSFVKDALVQTQKLDVYEYCLTMKNIERTGHLKHLIWEPSTAQGLFVNKDRISRYFADMLQDHGGLGKFMSNAVFPTFLPSQPTIVRTKFRCFALPTKLYRPNKRSLWTVLTSPIELQAMDMVPSVMCSKPSTANTETAKNVVEWLKMTSPIPMSVPMSVPVPSPSPSPVSTPSKKRGKSVSVSPKGKKKKSGPGDIRVRDSSDGINIRQEPESTRQARLLESIILKTKTYGVGPLEFCGVVKTIVHGIKYHLLYGDSSKWSPFARDVNQYREALVVCKDNLKHRRVGVLGSLLARRRSSSMMTRISRATSSLAAETANQDGERARKKRRIHADAAIILQGVAVAQTVHVGKGM